VDTPLLEYSLREAGITAFGFLSGRRLAEACSGLSDEMRLRYGVDRAKGAVSVALAYGEGLRCDEGLARYDGISTSHSGPRARIARFARANWYAELGARLDRAIKLTRDALVATGLEPGDPDEWRRLVNGGLPEKRIALEAGLGRIGRHSLLMLPENGSAVVIGVLLAPFDFPDSADPPATILDTDCESCGACMAACPTGALRGDGSMERELCLQHWSSIPGPLPAEVEAAWGDRLYGCDLCQEACPRFKPDPSARTDRGILGSGLSAHWIASTSEEEIRAALKGSALGMRWISIQALKRNARRIIAGDI
jgi:epoxyqueuosine reductase